MSSPARDASRTRDASGARRARRTPRVLTTALLVLGIAGLAVVAVGVLGYCSVFGCSVLAEDFEPHGEEATAARAAARETVTALAEDLTPGRVLADASADACRTGQNNWKRKDTYSHECFLTRSRVVLVTTDLAGVGDGLTAADATLRAAGCTPASPRGGLTRVRDEYWQPGNPEVGRRAAAGLPGSVYRCGGGRIVSVEPTSRREPSGPPEVAFAPLTLDDVLSAQWYTPEDVTALKGSGAELALVVTVEQSYYRTRF